MDDLSNSISAKLHQNVSMNLPQQIYKEVRALGFWGGFFFFTNRDVLIFLHGNDDVFPGGSILTITITIAMHCPAACH